MIDRRQLVVTLLPAVFAMLAGGCSSQTGSPPVEAYGVELADRTVDWSTAGVLRPDGTRGIPTRTTLCATIDAVTYGDGVTDATAAIQAAIDGCADDRVVFLPAGTYAVGSAGLRITRPIVLRGAGASRTKLVTSGSIVFDGYQSSASTHVLDWTGGYLKGETAITLASTAGLSVGQEIVLDQLNDSGLVNVVGNEGHCGYGGAGNACGRNDDISASTCHGFCGGDQRAMPQIVRIASLDGARVAIDTPLYFDHQASRRPQVFFWDGGNLAYAGIEDLSIDAQYNARAVVFRFCSHCWASGIAVQHLSRGAVWAYWTYHLEIRDSYFSRCQAVAPLNYGLELDDTTATLAENNVFDETIAGLILGWANSGAVLAYNYTVNDGPGSQLVTTNLCSHAAHNYMNLLEGNVTPRVSFDFVWGSSSHETLFRNRLSGFKDPRLHDYWTNFNQPVVLDAWNRYVNVIGNVLGTAGIHDVYQTSATDLPSATGYFDRDLHRTGWTSACSGGGNLDCSGMGVGPIYTLGYVNSYHVEMGSDPLVAATLLRWGNFDHATGQVRWELDELPGAEIPSQVLPASMYLAAKPSWWGSTPWPPIGPDITTGDADPSGHAFKIPAQLCYEKTVAEGSSFDASACYPR